VAAVEHRAESGSRPNCTALSTLVPAAQIVYRVSTPHAGLDGMTKRVTRRSELSAQPIFPTCEVRGLVVTTLGHRGWRYGLGPTD